MNYEKIILELMGRIQVLEEQVAELMKEKTEDIGESVNKITTEDIRRYIIELKQSAKENGETSIVLRSGDIHKDLKLQRSLPKVCNAMRQVMNDRDIIERTTPSGNSSTIEIRYYV